MKRAALLLLIFLASCATEPIMTRGKYESITIGTPITVVEEEVGKPYTIKKKNDGTEEYEYIERFDMSTTLQYDNRYFIIVEDGKVVGKYKEFEQPPAYVEIYQDDPTGVANDTNP